jgi:hypothetical protein
MTRLTAQSLAKDIDQFLVFKHALGYPYRRGEATLRSFQRFATPKLERNATIDLATAINVWLSRGSNRKPVTRALELGPVRQLCHFRRRRDPTGYVPSVSLAPQTESQYVPYIFSIEQIRALLEAARRHQGRNFWPGLLRLIILATYCPRTPALYMSMPDPRTSDVRNHRSVPAHPGTLGACAAVGSSLAAARAVSKGLRRSVVVVLSLWQP